MTPTNNSIEQIHQKNDKELVELSLEDKENYVYIINRYKQKLGSYIARLTNVRDEDQEDILQEVFLKVFLNLNDFDTSMKFSSWIYRITHNQVISFFRKHKVRPQGNTIELDIEEFNNLTSDLNIEKETDHILLKEKIEKVLFRLEEKYREILVLKYLEEKSYEEISDILKKPVGTVASLLNRAKKELRIKLEKDNIKI